ncbi:unnamed protein product [marine sediment metagenome]|uniref:Uncharacterized protein n=1 Tax=marine sediment metagenome TaxID=412755 RepID=X1PUH0_9ZZZZ
MLGTNPLTYGAPTDEEFPFLMDAATSIIQRGKVEVYRRIKKPLPNGLIISSNGNSKTDPEIVLNKLLNRSAALLPLGGEGEATSGYKGYGYATLAEILSAALQDGIFLRDTAGITENDKSKVTKAVVGFILNLVEKYIKPLIDSKKLKSKYNYIDIRDLNIEIKMYLNGYFSNIIKNGSSSDTQIRTYLDQLLLN